jgi:hypothetical protein
MSTEPDQAHHGLAEDGGTQAVRVRALDYRVALRQVDDHDLARAEQLDDFLFVGLLKR